MMDVLVKMWQLFNKSKLVLFVLLSVLNVSNGTFTKTPPALKNIYQNGSVTFDWEFDTSNGISAIQRKWTHKTKDIIIASVTTTEDINQAYKGRVSYTPKQAGLTIFNLEISDEGEIACEVLLSTGTIIINSTQLKVLLPPKFVPLLHSEFIASEGGDTDTISCKVESRPGVTITWHTKGEQILPNNTLKYTITNSNEAKGKVVETISTFKLLNANKADFGIYTCNAANEFNTVETKTTIKVYYPVEIKDFPSTIGTVESATNFTITCSAFGFPYPQVTWLRSNNAALSNPENYFYLNERKTDPTTNDEYLVSSLVIKAVQSSDFGEYICSANNTIPNIGEKTATASTNLIVSQKPYFLAKPDNFHYVTLDSTVVLNCTVQAFTKPFIWWQTDITKDERFEITETTLLNQNGKAIVELLLTITKVMLKDVGEYRCLTNDTKDTESTSTTLLVQFAPVIVSKPSNQLKVEEFKMPKLSIRVNSFPASVTKWSYAADGTTYTVVSENINVQSLTSPKEYQNLTEYSLMFPQNMSRSRSGNYKAEISNSVGTKDVEIKIDVEWEPEFGSSSSISVNTSKDVQENVSVSFTCLIKSNPLSDIKWTKDNVEVTTGITTTTADTGTSAEKIKESILSISKAYYTANGTYTCIAKNRVAGIMKEKQTSRVLNIIYKPVLLAESKSDEVEISTTLQLGCQSRGYPPIKSYNWTKDGVQLAVNESQYVILFVQKSNEGVYQCSSSNSEGSSGVVTHNITVRVRPSFTTFPSCTGENGTLYCTCEGVGFPPPQVFWRKNESQDSRIIGRESQLNLTITSDIYGIYTCFLNNSNGLIKADYSVQTTFLTVGSWSTWSDCNTTCGSGTKTRSRVCKITTCAESLMEVNSCTVQCPVVGAQDGWHKDEYIIIWVAIPIIFVLIIICFLWVARRNRSSDKAIIVPINHNISNPPSLRTQRDIYLPDENHLPVVNNGYIPDHAEEVQPSPEPERVKTPSPPPNPQTDTIEVQMEFGKEDTLENRREPTYSKVGEHQDMNKPSPNDPDYNFFKHYDRAGGPPLDEQQLFEKDYQDEAVDDDRYMPDIGQENGAYYAKGFSD